MHRAAELMAGDHGSRPEPRGAGVDRQNSADATETASEAEESSTPTPRDAPTAIVPKKYKMHATRLISPDQSGDIKSRIGGSRASNKNGRMN